MATRLRVPGLGYIGAMHSQASRYRVSLIRDAGGDEAIGGVKSPHEVPVLVESIAGKTVHLVSAEVDIWNLALNKNSSFGMLLPRNGIRAFLNTSRTLLRISFEYALTIFRRCNHSFD